MKLPFNLGCDPEFFAKYGTQEAGFSKALRGIVNIPHVGQDSGDLIELRPDKADSVEGAVANLKAALEEAAGIMPYRLVSRAPHRQLGGHIHVEKPEDGVKMANGRKPVREGLAWALCMASAAMRAYEDYEMNMCRANISAQKNDPKAKRHTAYMDMNGYGLPTDWRDSCGGRTIEVRGQTAEWTSSPESAEAAFSLMAMVRHEYAFGNTFMDDGQGGFIDTLCVPYGMGSPYEEGGGSDIDDDEDDEGGCGYAVLRRTGFLIDPDGAMNARLRTWWKAALPKFALAEKAPKILEAALHALDPDWMRAHTANGHEDVLSAWKVASKKPGKDRLVRFILDNAIVSARSERLRDLAVKVYAGLVTGEEVNDLPGVHIIALKAERGYEKAILCDTVKGTLAMEEGEPKEKDVGTLVTLATASARGGRRYVLMMPSVLVDEFAKYEEEEDDAGTRRIVRRIVKFFVAKVREDRAGKEAVCAE